MRELIDQYAAITRQIMALEVQQAALAEEIKAHGAGRYEGTYVAVKATPVKGRKTVNWHAVAAQCGIPQAVIDSHTTTGEDGFRLDITL